MNRRFFIFIAIVATVLGLSAFYIGVRLITWSEWAGSHSEIVWLTLGLFVVLQFLGPYLYRVFPDHTNRLFFIHWATYTGLGVFACMFFYTLAADVLSGLWGLVFPAYQFGHLELWAVTAMVLGTVVVGGVQAIAGPRVYRVDVPVSNLANDLHGFSIVQITDVHLGPTIGRRYLQRCVNIANSLAPDVVALTGDFVDGSVSQLRGAAAPLAHLKAKHGAYFITGNHEYYWGANGWLSEFQRLGARPLVNQHVVIQHYGAQVVLAGVTDYSAGKMAPGHVSDPAKSLEGAPAGTTKVLLAHHPSSYKEAAAAGFHLQLSGHTHGGQFFPFSLLVALSHRYYKGLHKLGGMWLYVSRGTGYWGPPLRFGVPAEITHIRLVRA